MCMIIHNPTGKSINPDPILDRNPDGCGFFNLKTRKLRKTLSVDTARKWLTSGVPYVAHCRYATAGDNGIDNVHPFPIGRGGLMMHNGTISGYPTSARSDSQQLAHQLKHVRDVPAFLSAFDSRFALIYPRRKRPVVRVGHWIDVDGVWYSKPLHVPRGHLVGVYGTLKLGHCNHQEYLGDAKFVGDASTSDAYRLCIEGLPYLIDGPDWDGGTFVDLEVYSVSDSQLAQLDRLEGHPYFYCRRQIDVWTYDDRLVNVWVYFAPESYDMGEYHDAYDEYSASGL